MLIQKPLDQTISTWIFKIAAVTTYWPLLVMGKEYAHCHSCRWYESTNGRPHLGGVRRLIVISWCLLNHLFSLSCYHSYFHSFSFILQLARGKDGFYTLHADRKYSTLKVWEGTKPINVGFPSGRKLAKHSSFFRFHMSYIHIDYHQYASCIFNLSLSITSSFSPSLVPESGCKG